MNIENFLNHKVVVVLGGVEYKGTLTRNEENLVISKDGTANNGVVLNESLIESIKLLPGAKAPRLVFESDEERGWESFQP